MKGLNKIFRDHFLGFGLHLNSLDLLLDKVFLVFWQSHCHHIVIVLNVGKHRFDGVLAIVEDLLTLLKVLKSCMKIEPLLHLLDLLLSLLKFNSNCFKTLSIAFPCSFGVL
jgi:hypothetical protein